MDAFRPIQLFRKPIESDDQREEFDFIARSERAINDNFLMAQANMKMILDQNAEILKHLGVK